MSEMISKVQFQIKKTSTGLATLSLKVFVGLVIGLTLSMVVLELLGKKESENWFSFVLMMVTTLGLFLKVSNKWSLTAVLIFSLIMVLIALVLRLYVMVAPGL